MFRVLLNGIETQSVVEGVGDLEENFRISEDLQIYLIEVVGNLVFTGKDFQTLFTIFKESPCSVIPTEIHKKTSDSSGWSMFFKGNIFINDATFDFSRKVCTAELVDDNLISKIVNNADSLIDMSLTTTKNGQPISLPIQTFNVVDFNNVQHLNRVGHTIFDVLDYAVRWVSDNVIRLESDFLSLDPSVTFYRISNEASARTGATTYPSMSFSDIWNDVRRLFRLRGYFIKTSFGYNFKVEPSEFFSQPGYHSLTNTKQIAVSTGDDQWTKEILFGSAQCLTSAPDDTNLWFPFPTIGQRLFYHNNKDSVIPPTECNNENKTTLRLQKLITDNAIINTVLNSTQNTDWDNEPILWHDENNHECIPLYNVNGNRIFNTGISNIATLSKWQSEICVPDSVFSDCETEMSFDVPAFPTGQTLGNAAFLLNVPFIINSSLSNDNCGLLQSGFPVTFSIGPGVYKISINYNFEQYAGTTPNVFFGMRFLSPFWLPFGGTLRTLLRAAPGWGTAVGPVCDDIYDYLIYPSIGVGHLFSYTQEVTLLIPFNLSMAFLGAASEANAVRLLPSSTVTISNVLSEEYGLDQNCEKYAYTSTMEASIGAIQMDDIKNSPFKAVFVENNFRNITGQIKRISRKADSGMSSVELQMKNI